MSFDWKAELREVKQLYEDGLITKETLNKMQESILTRKNQGSPTNENSKKSQPPSRNKVQDTLGVYNLFERVGEGGMGVVYRARHSSEEVAISQGGDVALKLLHLEGSSNQEVVERFKSEGKTGMELDHPNIVKVFHHLTENNQNAIVMEFAEGEDLQAIIERRKTVFQWREIREWVGLICDAMSYAHAQGIVHRDIKPENIMISSEGKLTILDFSIAKRQNDAKKTQVGVGMGTPIYMAPEQYFNATNVDGRADIYALAVMIVEMLTNRLPWDDQLSEDKIYQVKLKNEFDLDDILRTFPPHFRKGINQALQGNPQLRQKTMYDFFEDLYPKQTMVMRKTNKTIVFEPSAFPHLSEDSVRKNNEKTKVISPTELPYSVPSKKEGGTSFVTGLIWVCIIVGGFFLHQEYEHQKHIQGLHQSADQANYGFMNTTINRERAFALYSEACELESVYGCLRFAIILFRGFGGIDRDEAKALTLAATKTLRTAEEECAQDKPYVCDALGDIWYDGVGIDKNLKKSVVYYQQACDQGYTTGCYHLGILYQNGEGIEKDNSKTIELFLEACNGSHATACYDLGTMYKNGIDVEQNDKRAATMYKKGCNSSHVESCYHLGFMYKEGVGVSQSDSDAALPFEKSCKGKQLDGCYQLALMYKNGKGVRSDEAKSAQYFRQSCVGKHVEGCYNLGVAYKDGIGVPRSNKNAVRPFQAACDGGQVDGCYQLAIMYKDGDGVDSDARKSAKLFQKACNGEEMNGCYRLGKMYEDGDGIEKDISSAADLYLKACKAEHSSACSRCSSLGYDYDQGVDGVKEDKKRAVQLYQVACDFNIAWVCSNLGFLYRDGKGVRANQKKAVSLLRKGCDGGNMHGCGALGYMYDEGLGVTKNYKKAAQFYKKGCDADKTPWCFNVALLYEYGQGVERSLSKAKQYFKKSCKNGYKEACSMY